MSKLKSHYFAGAVAAAIGTTPVTLRMWRDRGICHLGAVEEGSEDNPRARRRYSLLDACMMGVAVYLGRMGWNLETAFNFVTSNDEIRKALAAVIVGLDRPDAILSKVDANGGSEEGQGWNHHRVISIEQWKAGAHLAFEAADYLTGQICEGFFSFNISAIARRVISTLPAIEDGEA